MNIENIIAVLLVLILLFFIFTPRSSTTMNFIPADIPHRRRRDHHHHRRHHRHREYFGPATSWNKMAQNLKKHKPKKKSSWFKRFINKKTPDDLI